MLFKVVLFYGSAILVGIIFSIVLEKVSVFVDKKKKTASTTDTSVESHIEDCISFKPDNGKTIDEVVKNLKNANIDPPFSS